MRNNRSNNNSNNINSRNSNYNNAKTLTTYKTAVTSSSITPVATSNSSTNNHSATATSGTTITTTTDISSKHVLASNYIPDHDRIWSEKLPNVTLIGTTIENCIYSNNNNKNNNKNNTTDDTSNDDDDYNHNDDDDDDAINDNDHLNHHPITWPNAIQEFNSEFRYAIETRKAKVMKQQSQSQSQQVNNNNKNKQQQTNYNYTQRNTHIQQHQQQQHIDNNIPSVLVSDIIDNNIQTYIHIFRTLLQIERKEILLQYENYTQYNQKFTILIDQSEKDQSEKEQLTNLSYLAATTASTTNNKNNTSLSASASSFSPLQTKSFYPKQQYHTLHQQQQQQQRLQQNNNQNQNKQQQQSQSNITIPISGIADSRPLPQRGDWIVLRPKSYISVPTRIVPTTNEIITWSPACNVVDIHCQITSVTRAIIPNTTNTNNNFNNNNINNNNNNNNKNSTIDVNTISDIVTATWLVPSDDHIIRTSYHRYDSDSVDGNQSTTSSSLYQMRIIPNKKEYERCMVALLWLNTTITKPDVMYPLLFPNYCSTTIGPSSSSSPTNGDSSLLLTLTNNNNNDDNDYVYKQKNRQHQHSSTTNVEEQQLNDQQKLFAQLIYNRTCQPSYGTIRNPILLTGPAGTGKTRALLHAIVQVLQQSNTNRILICTPSHTAANVITQRLASTVVAKGMTSSSSNGYSATTKRNNSNGSSSGSNSDNIILHPNELLRLLDSDRSMATIPISILSFCYQQQQQQQQNSSNSTTNDSFGGSRMQHHNNNAMGVSADMTNFFAVPPKDMLLKYRVIVCTCTDSYLLYKNNFTNQLLQYEKVHVAEQVQKQCATVNVQVTLHGIDEPHFTHFFMDEAAQATEIESLIPLSVVVDPNPYVLMETTTSTATTTTATTSTAMITNAASTNATTSGRKSKLNIRMVEVALVGDPRQLSPAIYSNSATIGGLSQSWIERLLQRTNNNSSSGTENDTTIGTLVSSSKQTQQAAALSTSGSFNNSHNSIRNAMLGPELLLVDDWIRYSMEFGKQEQQAVFLTLNYRGHPSFIMIPSSLFYSDRLQRAGYTTDEYEKELYWTVQLRRVESLTQSVMASTSMWKTATTKKKSKRQQSNGTAIHKLQNDVEDLSMSERSTIEEDYLKQIKQWNWPIHFRGVIGTDINSNVLNSFATDSWHNVEEAQVIVEIIKELIQSGNVSTNQIGVVAPYRGQVVLIRKLLRAQYLGAVDVGTIEDYQSAERDVIILSITRSNSAFIIDDIQHRMGVFGPSEAKRCNVALTRAQNLFIVVGNPKVMVQDFLWRQFLFFCYRNGLWYGESGGLLDDNDDDTIHNNNSLSPTTATSTITTTSSYFSWTKEEGSTKLPVAAVRIDSSYDALSSTVSSSSLNDNIIVISSLERTLRQI